MHRYKIDLTERGRRTLRFTFSALNSKWHGRWRHKLYLFKCEHYAREARAEEGYLKTGHHLLYISLSTGTNCFIFKSPL